MMPDIYQDRVHLENPGSNDLYREQLQGVSVSPGLLLE